MTTLAPATPAGTLKAGQPNDGLFRVILSDPIHAASVLRAWLPPALVARLDLARLTALPSTLVDELLKRSEPDMLLAVPLLDSQAGFVYILIEHQSRVDRNMPVRLLEHTIRIWKHHRRTHSRVTRLPAVFPVVVHHNRRRAGWTASTRLLEMVDLDINMAGAMGEYLARYRFVLDDLARVTEEDLLSRGLTDVAFLAFYLFKYAPGNPGVFYLDHVADRLRAIFATEYRDEFLTYIQSVGETPPAELLKLLAKLDRDAKEEFMTTIEMIRAEGLAEGKADFLLKVLAQLKLTVSPAAREQIMACTDLATLDRWLDRAFGVQSVEEIFA